ncbi:MAG TPA: hypothetical protein VI636_22430 [Candidatus Angelobacter sp.]
METSHLVLLLAIFGAVAGILGRMVLLLMRGAAAAKAAGSVAATTGIAPALAGPPQDGINWREINALPTPPLSSDRQYLRLLRNFTLPRIPWLPAAEGQREVTILTIQREAVADPVDGTLFQPGENVLRCSCGTCYHPHSWQWIGEKNGGRCVSCKQVALAS